ncbi:MAG TPA: alpha-glucuronidase family glycosyl hydrolase [Puia sp.]|nr:alpha-glucuronidase family glycosyl hydrolase [Puia sp.]
MNRLFCILLSIFFFHGLSAEDGYRLWLRYDLIKNGKILQEYRSAISGILFAGPAASNGAPALSAAKTELLTGLQGLLGKKIPEQQNIMEGSILAGTIGSYPSIAILLRDRHLEIRGEEGFALFSATLGGKHCLVITGNTSTGVLYGVFRLLRLIQEQQPVGNLAITDAPTIRYRILDHWDNLNRTVERGYAGISIWDWHKLPLYIDQRYTDYARANASVGINGAVLNNVNANAAVLTKEYLIKAAALANTLRPYGIKVYLSAKFSAPVVSGGLKTADPLDRSVQEWWKKKCDTIYSFIPDFGGFLVKANSEGQAGPQDYGRTHADGANMLADALAPHGGIVMWRAFVYSNETPEDRAKQAYTEFRPLDGKFRKNVVVQVKNGPIDFQPREPFHPLFGAMPATPLMMEFQLTQEYLGFATHLVYLAPLFKECLDADTYGKGLHGQGKGTTVASTLTGIAGVANIGNDLDWCGHPFAQANWYAFGRLAWDPELSSTQIADEWIRQTFSNDHAFVDMVKKMMLASREVTVDYMTPLGLHHIMGYGHHYGPAPWWDKASRADWNPVYYHKADTAGIGFDRTATGSNALEQYAPEARKQWEGLDTCPDQWLLWWHHVAWGHRMQSGRTLWEELCYKYNVGVDSVRWMQKAWNGMEKYIDGERWRQVKMLLAIQENEAVWWRNACLLYFQTFPKSPIPSGYERPDHTLDFYKELRFPDAPGRG